MERRERRRVDFFEGDGQITRGSAHLGTTHYAIAVNQDFIVLHDGDELEGMKDLKIILSDHTLDTFALWQGQCHPYAALGGRSASGRLPGRQPTGPVGFARLIRPS